jgi:hypothetical protein
VKDELKGYRVQLRFVEEHDVALLAESAEDARSSETISAQAPDRHCLPLLGLILLRPPNSSTNRMTIVR